MEVSSLGNHIVHIDGNAKADDPIAGLIAIIFGNLPLYFHGTQHCTVNAVKHDE